MFDVAYKVVVVLSIVVVTLVFNVACDITIVLDTIIVALRFNIAFVELVYSMRRCCSDLFFFSPPFFPSCFFEFS